MAHAVSFSSGAFVTTSHHSRSNHNHNIRRTRTMDSILLPQAMFLHSSPSLPEENDPSDDTPLFVPSSIPQTPTNPILVPRTTSPPPTTKPTTTTTTTTTHTKRQRPHGRPLANANKNGRNNNNNNNNDRSSTPVVVARQAAAKQRPPQKRRRPLHTKQKQTQKRRSYSRQHVELQSILHARPPHQSALQRAQLAQDYLDSWIQQATKTHQPQNSRNNSTQNSNCNNNNNNNNKKNTTLEETKQQTTGNHGAKKVLSSLPKPPDTFAVNLCLGAWSQCDSWEGATRAHALLNKCLEGSSSSLSNHHEYPLVDWVSFSACIHAHAKSNSRRRGAEAAEQIIRHQLLPYYHQHVAVVVGSSEKKNHTTTTIMGGDVLACIHAGMDAWTKSGTPDAGRRAEGLLEFLTTKLPSIQPTLGTYNAVILAWAKQPPQLQQSPSQGITSSRHTSGNNNKYQSRSAKQAAHDWLNRLEADPTLPSPCRRSYSMVLDAYAKHGDIAQAEALLSRMQQRSQQGYTHVRPDAIAYTTLISAYARCSSTSSPTLYKNHNNRNRNGRPLNNNDHGKDAFADRALQLLHTMEELSLNTKDDDDNDAGYTIQPNSVTYNAVLNAFAKQRTPRGAKMADTLLSKMEHGYKMARDTNGVGTTPSNNSNNNVMSCGGCMPTVVSYTAVMDAYAKSGMVTAGEMAERLLERMQELNRLYPHPSLEPNAICYSAILNGWAKSASRHHPEAADRADRLLRQMEHSYYIEGKNKRIQPTTILYNTVLSLLGHLREKRAVDMAFDLLKRMERWGLQNPEACPDANTYALVMNVMTKSGHPHNKDEAAFRAEELWNEAQRRYQGGGSVSVKNTSSTGLSPLYVSKMRPTSLLYSALLQAHAKRASRAGAERAHALLTQFKDDYDQSGAHFALKPTTLAYNAVLDAHARSGTPDCGERAQDLLDQMERLYRNGDEELKLTRRTYNAVLLAWKNSPSLDAPHQAEALFHRMNAKYQATGDRSIQPDQATYHCVMTLLVERSGRDAAAKAESILESLEQQYFHDDSSPSTSMSRGTSNSFSSSYINRRDNHKLNGYPYSIVIQAWAKAGGNSGARHAHTIFVRMLQYYRAGRKQLKPDIRSVTSLLEAWVQKSHRLSLLHLDDQKDSDKQQEEQEEVREKIRVPLQYMQETYYKVQRITTKRNATITSVPFTTMEAMVLGYECLHSPNNVQMQKEAKVAQLQWMDALWNSFHASHKPHEAFEQSVARSLKSCIRFQQHSEKLEEKDMHNSAVVDMLESRHQELKKIVTRSS